MNVCHSQKVLHIAAWSHNVEELHRGLSQGFVTTDDTLYLDRTALQWAIINSAGAPPENPAVRDTVKFLLGAGADPQKTVYGDSLGAIALNDQVETAFDLLKHLQKDIQSLNPCNLPDPSKHSGLWGYMLTPKMLS